MVYLGEAGIDCNNNVCPQVMIMGSINDFTRPQFTDTLPKRKKRGSKRIILVVQLVASCLLVLFVWSFWGNSGLLGEYARYIRNDGLSMADSWLPFDEVLPAAAKLGDVPDFSAPLSGVVVKDFSASNSVLIQGSQGEFVKASAQGTVMDISSLDSGYYALEIDHGNAYRTVYANLEQVSVIKGQVVEKGAELGLLGTSPLAFMLKNGDLPLDAVEYIFGHEST